MWVHGASQPPTCTAWGALMSLKRLISTSASPSIGNESMVSPCTAKENSVHGHLTLSTVGRLLLLS